MKTVALVIVMLLASHVSSLPLVNFSWDTPRHFCGSQLANVLALICHNGYNSNPVNDEVTVPSRRRKRVPIVEECCENTCTPHHLKSYCWKSQKNDTKNALDPSVEKPSVDKIAKPPQKNPANNTLSQRPGVADNSLLAEHPTAQTKSNCIISNSKEIGDRQNSIKPAVPYAPKKEAMIAAVQSGQVPGRVKTVTPYFDKMPSVIITKTQP